MKHRITVSAQDADTKIAISALVTTSRGLSRGESYRIRDTLADRLMETVPGLPYGKIHAHQVKVK